EELAGLEALVIPGGESTTLLKLMGDAFPPALAAFHAAGRPIYGTCAGLILLARQVVNPVQPCLGFIDVTAERNAYGRQREPFEVEAEARPGGLSELVRMVFIRAPRITRTGPDAGTLATVRDEPVLARQGPVLVGSFHPELTDDLSVHRFFTEMVA